jgi:hypothetical protein
MKKLKIEAGPFVFMARVEDERAPLTCQKFTQLLFFRSSLNKRGPAQGCAYGLDDI